MSDSNWFSQAGSLDDSIDSDNTSIPTTVDSAPTIKGSVKSSNVSSGASTYIKPVKGLKNASPVAKNTRTDSTHIKSGSSINGKPKSKNGRRNKASSNNSFFAKNKKTIIVSGFPIVLHGSSSVPQDLVKIINTYGGKLKDAIGIPEEQLRKAAASAVCKINIDSDGRLAMTAAVRKVLAEKPAEFDPRKYLGPAREALKELYKHKNINVLGSAGKA